MKRVPRQKKLALQFIRPARLDKTQVELLVRPIDFVSDQRMTQMREMNANLVRPSGPRSRPDDRAFLLLPNDTAFDPELGHRRRTLFVDRLLQPNGGGTMRPLPGEGRIHDRRFPLRPVMDKAEIFLLDLAALHRQTKASCRRPVFCDQTQPA